MTKRKPKGAKDPTPAAVSGTRQYGSAKPPQKAADQSHIAMESRERREAEMAALLRQVGAARVQRDSAVAALEVIAAESAGPESPTERSYRMLAASALARVQSLGRLPRTRTFGNEGADAEEVRFDG